LPKSGPVSDRPTVAAPVTGPSADEAPFLGLEKAEARLLEKGLSRSKQGM